MRRIVGKNGTKKVIKNDLIQLGTAYLNQEQVVKIPENQLSNDYNNFLFTNTLHSIPSSYCSSIKD